MILNYFKLIRWPNLLMMALVMFCLRYFLILPQFDNAGIIEGSTILLFILLIISVLCIAGGGYIINDVLDQEIDAVNHPENQLIGKVIVEKSARLFYLGLTSFGLVTGIYLAYIASSAYFGLIFPAMAALLYYYSIRYKRQLISGNIVVSFASAMVLIVVWNFELFLLDAENTQLAENKGVISFISKFVYAYTLFAFFSSLIRELVKDIEDIAGDEADNCATIPILLGVSFSRRITIVMVLLLMIMVGYWQYWLWFDGFHYASGFLIFTQAIIVFTIIKLFHPQIKWHQVSNLLKMLMLTGITSIIFLNIYA
jgi:4-hydroxybenzoate polyprenyltransferase